MSEIKKATTSDSLVDNSVTPEEVAQGETKPTIQDAMTASELLSQRQAPPNPVNVTNYQIGSTLVQTPHGNMFSNFKPSPIDYVAAAKPKGVVTMTEEELKQFSEQQLNKTTPQKFAEEIKGPAKVNEVMQRVPEEMRPKVLEHLRSKAEKAKEAGDEETYKTCNAMCQRIEKMKD